MKFPRPIIAIFLMPIIWLSNLLSRKNNNLEWNFIYGSFFTKIETKYKDPYIPDDLLIASYLLFLARYFYICDERQPNLVREYLLRAIKEKGDANELGGKLYEAIFQTLDKTEKEAVVSLFKGFSLPPTMYTEKEDPGHSFAKYSFLVFESHGQLNSTFHMSFGPDIVLLPLTVGVLYAYVVNKLRGYNKKEELDKLVIELLEAHKSVDCRSQEGLHGLPVKIINEHNLNY